MDAAREHRGGGRGRRWAGAALLLGVAAIVMLFFFVERGGAPAQRDADMCLPGTPPMAVTLLVDFQKPVPAAHYATLVRDVSLDLPAEAETVVFALASDADRPRLLVGRLCKPYDNADLAVGAAKDARGGRRDCDDLPAQLPPDTRELANRFCGLRQGLQRRLERLGRFRDGGQVANALVLEAIDASVYELAERAAGDRGLYVFSDMLQHADWYSHLDLEWDAWGFERFAGLRRVPGAQPGAAHLSGLRVRILYIPRVGLTDGRRPRGAHQTFWRAYFGPAETEFRELPALPAYTALPLTPPLGDPAAAERERRALEERRDAVERELERIAEEATRLEEERRSRARRLAEHDALQEELRSQEEALRREVARLREEVARRTIEPETTESDAAPADVPRPDAALPDAAPAEPVAVAETASAPSVTCTVRLEPRFLDALRTERYAGDRRANYGAATVVVRYVVGARGAVVEGEIVADRSTAERPEHLDVLAEDAVGVVRGWSFVTDEPAGPGACGSGRQEGLATFVYRERCVGRPVPSCRTVQAGVRLHGPGLEGSGLPFGGADDRPGR